MFSKSGCNGQILKRYEIKSLQDFFFCGFSNTTACWSMTTGNSPSFAALSWLSLPNVQHFFSSLCPVNCLWSHNLRMLWFILKTRINTASCQKDKVKKTPQNQQNHILYIHHQVPLSNITFIAFKMFELVDPCSWQEAIIEITNFYSWTWNILAKQWKEKKSQKEKDISLPPILE